MHLSCDAFDFALQSSGRALQGTLAVAGPLNSEPGKLLLV